MQLLQAIDRYAKYLTSWLEYRAMLSVDWLQFGARFLFFRNFIFDEAGVYDRHFG